MLHLHFKVFFSPDDGAGGGGAGDPPEAAPPRTVPYARFNEVNTKLAALEGRLAELEPIAGKYEKTAADLVAAREETSLVRAGVTDPDDVDVLRLHYGKLTGEAKPKTIGDYAAALKAEGAVVPKSLQHLFTPAPAPAPDGKPAPGAPPRKPLPKPGGTEGGPPPTTPAYSSEAIRELTEEARRTRDFTKLNAAMADIRAQAAKRKT